LQVERFSINKIEILKLTLILSLFGGFFLFYFLFNPSTHSFFIPCPFKWATGYLCPGCGSQRAIHLLLHGNIIGAFRFNPLMVLSLPIIIYGLGIMIWNFIFNTQLRFKLFYSNTFIYIYFGIVLIYWIVRNISFHPFTFLAPTD
jgi:hypothetical protein